MLKLKGGYFMVDGTGVDLSSAEEQTIPGAWNQAKAAVEGGKPLVFYNTVYGSGVPVSPVPGFGWYISETEIVLVGATLHIHVKNTDKVTVLDVAAS